MYFICNDGQFGMWCVSTTLKSPGKARPSSPCAWLVVVIHQVSWCMSHNLIDERSESIELWDIHQLTRWITDLYQWLWQTSIVCKSGSPMHAGQTVIIARPLVTSYNLTSRTIEVWHNHDIIVYNHYVNLLDNIVVKGIYWNGLALTIICR